MLVNKGDPKVSPESAAFYGYVTAVVRTAPLCTYIGTTS